MEYKIVWFTEGGWTGKVPRNHPNMRNDMAWMHVLDVDHYPIFDIHNVHKEYDLGIVTIPKTNIDKLSQYPLIDQMRRICKKVGTMQEGTYWYWQDNEIEEQIWYFNILLEFDLILCHNDIDLKYYSGLLNKSCKLLPTLMIDDYVKKSDTRNESVMIGGNFVSIYRGIDSYMVALEISNEIWAPTTGRMKDKEKEMDIKHLPWVTWLDWIYELSKHKYGVQLGTPSAGTFNLNCSFLGIPCIGYDNVNTQKILHPSLSVEEGDMKRAKELAVKLKNDDFYKYCSDETRELYKNKYSEEKFIEIWKEIKETL